MKNTLSFSVRGVGYSTKLAILLACFLVFGCGSSHQQRVNVISNAADVLLTSYQTAEVGVVAANKAGAFDAETREKISNVRAKASPVMRRIAIAWQQVPKIDASVEAFILSPDFQDGLALVMEIAQLAGLDEILGQLKPIKEATEQ